MWDSVADYYKSSQWLYRLFIYNKDTLGMHFGFWDVYTKNRQQAILNENDEIIRLAGIKKGMVVLDAGCTQDFGKTNFANDYFDVIFGIESLCYASPKTNILKELHRILKPGGILIIADGYLKGKSIGYLFQKEIKDFMNAFALKEFVTGGEMVASLKKAGFSAIQSNSYLNRVKTVLYWLVKLGGSFFRPIYANSLALELACKGASQGFMDYLVIKAVK